jgi:hypothetical protein
MQSDANQFKLYFIMSHTHNKQLIDNERGKAIKLPILNNL